MARDGVVTMGEQRVDRGLALAQGRSVFDPAHERVEGGVEARGIRSRRR